MKVIQPKGRGVKMKKIEIVARNNLEQEIRKIVKDMLWLANEKLNEKADHDAVRWYHQGQADALRQWAKTIERLLKKEPSGK